MRDIAAEVGVSAVTVSKALAGKPGMSESVRREIRKAAERMGYVYPAPARSEEAVHLDIGILIPEHFFSVQSFYAEMYKKLSRRLTESGHYGVMELIPRSAEENLTLPQVMAGGRVRGAILLGQPLKPYVRFLAKQSLPILFLDFFDEHALADAVVGDNAYGCYRLTSHLIKNGHTRIGFVGNCRATTSIMDRFLGFYRAMLSHDLPLRPEWVIEDRDAENNLYPELTLPREMPTAFVCNCDVVARKLINQLAERGIRVPEDVSVTGFDDFEIESSPGPGISTFRVDTDGMVDLAVRRMADRCAGLNAPYGRTVVSGQPVYRESDGIPRPGTGE